jgi:hypothetical protein
MNAKADGSDPQRGDVLHVGYADPEKAAQLAEYMDAGQPGPWLAPSPDADERVTVRLAGYPYLFTVRVVGGRTGPVIRHLEVTADADGEVVDYEALRSIPLRRITLSAWNWRRRYGGTVAEPGDNDVKTARPDDADADRLGELVNRVESAILSGLPVRRTVAAEMNLGTATVDRMIRRAKDAGLMDGIEIPKRPGPRQRDTTTTITGKGNDR